MVLCLRVDIIALLQTLLPCRWMCVWTINSLDLCVCSCASSEGKLPHSFLFENFLAHLSSVYCSFSIPHCPFYTGCFISCSQLVWFCITVGLMCEHLQQSRAHFPQDLTPSLPSAWSDLSVLFSLSSHDISQHHCSNISYAWVSNGVNLSWQCASFLNIITNRLLN